MDGSTMTTTDRLAAALSQLVTDLNGYKNCPAIRAMTVNAVEVLAEYDAEQARQAEKALDATAQTWARIQANYPELWQEWLDVGLMPFHIWLQASHPEAWGEYVRETQ